ncbi:hypothetical protein V1511DRAFT_496090 [Dipodascopsis uninucleata]
MSSKTDLSLIAWVNSAYSSELSDDIAINTLSELSDGVILSKILAKAWPGQFKSCEIASGESLSFITRAQNLKKLFKALTTFYVNVLGGTNEKLLNANMSLIAKDSQLLEIKKLATLTLIVTKGTSCFDAINNIDEEYKNDLLDIISKEENSSLIITDSYGSSIDFESRLQAEIAKALDRYHTVEDAYEELKKQYSSLQDEHDQIKQENAILSDKLNDTSGMSRIQAEIVEKKTQTQIEYLQKDIQDLEEQIASRDLKLEQDEEHVSTLLSQIDSLEAELENTVIIKDSLDEAKHEIDRLRKLAAQAERQKAQLAEMANLQQQLTVLQNENTYLSEKSKLLNEDTQEVFGLRRQNDVLQSENEFFRKKNRDMERELNALLEKADRDTQELRSLREEHSRDIEQISELEERIRDLDDLKRGETIEQSMNSSEHAELLATINELKSEISKLDLELSIYRNNTTANTSIEEITPSIELDSKLHNCSTSDLKQIPADLMLENLENATSDNLWSGIRKVRSALVEDDERTEIIRKLQDKLHKSENETDQVKEQMRALEEEYQSQKSQLEAARLELDLIGKDEREIIADVKKSVSGKMETLQRDYEYLRQQKAIVESINEKTTEQLQMLNKDKEEIYQKLSLASEELLEISRANTALRTSLSYLDPSNNTYESELKSWVIDLQRRIETQREKLKAAQENIRRLKVDNERLKRNILHSDKEKKNMIAIDEAANIKREISLMTSAWYMLTSHIQQDKVVVGKKVQDSPSSWLNTQRKILEARK